MIPKCKQVNINSAEEQIIGKWTNGKPLYRKVIETNMPTCATNGTSVYSNINHNIDNIGIIFVENAFIDVDGQYYTLPSIHDNNYKVDIYKITNSVVQLRNGIVSFSGKNVMLY